MELQLDRLTKHFGSTIAVDRVSTSLSPGIYGLLGANGSGKTTLMRMICGVLKPTSGHITYNGTETSRLGEDYRDILGYLPQDFGYYPEFSAHEFMCYLAALKGLNRKQASSRSQELLDLVGLKDVAKHKIKTFSGGMKQRLGIAQAMINDPKILILDEPTSGLDPKERVRFRNLISSFSRDRIVILSTHIVSDIEYIADTIILMKAGKFELIDSPELLVTHLNGKVWECVVERQEADRMAASYSVSNLQHTNDNRVVLRIISEAIPFAGATPLSPTLEDLYLYHFQEETYNDGLTNAKVDSNLSSLKGGSHE